jgi:hypothetical protein
LAVLTITNMHHSLLIQINKQGNVIITFIHVLDQQLVIHRQM